MRTPPHWQHRGVLSTLLLPAAWIYAAGAAIDRALTTPQHAALPVIGIGNLTAGGAGKTPTAIAIAQLLQRMGRTPHLLTRGYGSKGRGIRRADAQGQWEQVGDEAMLLACTAPTWVSADRLAAVGMAQLNGADLLVADDALQHHRLHKNVSLLVIDGPFGFGNGELLPAGPLREPTHTALARCNAVLIIGENRQQLQFELPTFTAQLVPSGDTAWLAGAKLLAFAGLGRPQKFYDTLTSHGAQLVGTQDFPDHHPYSAAELDALLATAERLGATPITTAKDAVKFPPPYRDRIRTLDVALQFDDAAGFENWLKNALVAPI